MLFDLVFSSKQEKGEARLDCGRGGLGLVPGVWTGGEVAWGLCQVFRGESEIVTRAGPRYSTDIAQPCSL